MKLEKNKKYTTIALYACAVIAFGIVFACVALNIGVVWAVISRILKILNPIICGFVIAFIVNPLVKLIEKIELKKIKDVEIAGADGKIAGIKSRATLRRVIAIIISFLLLLSVISALITLLVPQVIESYGGFFSKLTSYVSGAQGWASSFIGDAEEKGGAIAWIVEKFDIEKFAESINKTISDSYSLLNEIVPYIGDFVTSVLDSVKNLMIGLIISVYFLFSKEKLCAQVKKTMFALTNDSFSARALKTTRKTSESFTNFISGKLLDSLIIGVITFFVMMIFDMPYYPLIAVIVGVTNIIPFFGPFIGAIPSAFIIFVAEPMKCLWFVILIIIIQQLDGNVIGPKILGGQTGLSALWIIFSITLMGGIFGITGMLIGVPVVAVLYSLISELVSAKLTDKNRAVFTESYKNVNGTGDIPTLDEEKQNMENAVPVIKRRKLTDIVLEWAVKTAKKLISKIKKK